MERVGWETGLGAKEETTCEEQFLKMDRFQQPNNIVFEPEKVSEVWRMEPQKTGYKVFRMSHTK